MLQGLRPCLVQVGKDRPGQLELATGLKGDVGTLPGQGDDVLAFVKRGPAKFGNKSTEKGLNITCTAGGVRGVRGVPREGNRAEISEVIEKLFMLRTDPPL